MCKVLYQALIAILMYLLVLFSKLQQRNIVKSKESSEMFSPFAISLWKGNLLTLKLVIKVSVDQKLIIVLHVNNFLFLMWWVDIPMGNSMEGKRGFIFVFCCQDTKQGKNANKHI